MNGIQETVIQFLGEHGSELVLSVVSFLAATLVSYVRENGLKLKAAELQKDVDHNKELLSRQSNVINTALSQQQKSQSYTIERQAKAAEKAWKEVLKLRELSAPCVTIDRILLPEERHGEILCRIGGPSPDDAMQRVKEYCNDDCLEELRPYLGEKLWVEFFALRTFSCRCLFYYAQCVSKNKDVVWTEDDGIRQMLRWVVKDEKTIGELYSKKMDFLQASQEVLEGMVYRSISRILTGEAATEDSVRAISSLQSLLRFDVEDGQNRG